MPQQAHHIASEHRPALGAGPPASPAPRSPRPSRPFHRPTAAPRPLLAAVSSPRSSRPRRLPTARLTAHRWAAPVVAGLSLSYRPLPEVVQLGCRRLRSLRSSRRREAGARDSYAPRVQRVPAGRPPYVLSVARLPAARVQLHSAHKHTSLAPRGSARHDEPAGSGQRGSPRAQSFPRPEPRGVLECTRSRRQGSTTHSRISRLPPASAREKYLTVIRSLVLLTSGHNAE
jgi:hypothetical protein